MLSALKTKAGKVWMIVSTILIIFAVVLNVLASTMFNGLFDTVFGGVRPVYDEDTVSMHFPWKKAQKSAYLEKTA